MIPPTAASDSVSVSAPTSETILSESVVKALTSPSRGVAVQGNGHASTRETVRSTTGSNSTVVSQSTYQTSVPTPATVTREDDRRAATVEAVLRSICAYLPNLIFLSANSLTPLIFLGSRIWIFICARTKPRGGSL